MPMVTVGFIGTGKMAEALMRSIRKNNNSVTLVSSDSKEERLQYIKKELGACVTQINGEVAAKADVIFLSVKPQDMQGVLTDIKPFVKGKLIVSIAAGIPIKKISSTLGYDRIIRVMPNTPCLVGEMAGAYSKTKSVTADDQHLFEKLLKDSGMLFEVDEVHIDAVTALSGSGPAFFALFVKALADAAVKEGLDGSIALQLASKTALGTGKLLLEKNMTPDDLITMVASPRGTTVAGLECLERNNCKNILEQAYAAAVKRAREIAQCP